MYLANEGLNISDVVEQNENGEIYTTDRGLANKISELDPFGKNMGFLMNKVTPWKTVLDETGKKKKVPDYTKTQYIFLYNGLRRPEGQLIKSGV